MSRDNLSSIARPRLAALLPNATQVSPARRTIALLRPWPPVLVLVGAAALRWWPLAAMAVAFVFAATVVVIHDLFHRNLALHPRTNERLIFLYGCLLLNSGHALSASHRHHHRVYPAAGDPEAYVDGWPVWRVLLPRYRFRLWDWAPRNQPEQRRILLAEMSIWALVWGRPQRNRLP